MHLDLRPVLDPVLRRIQTLCESDMTPRLVVIDGRSGTGKSSIASLLSSCIGAPLISGDDFYAGGVVVHENRSATELADICIDRERLRTVLETLKAGNPASFAAFDWNAFDGRFCDEQSSVQPGRVLILEGVYAFHPSLRHLADLSVLIEVPEQTRMQRLLAREGELSAWESQWQRAEDWYFKELSPPGIYDLRLING